MDGWVGKGASPLSHSVWECHLLGYFRILVTFVTKVSCVSPDTALIS